MSGIEVAGLVFGVIPVVVETLKLYGTLRSTILALCNFSSTLRRLQLKLSIQHQIFRNECQLLLSLTRSVYGNAAVTIDALAQDDRHPFWLIRPRVYATSNMEATHDCLLELVAEISRALRHIIDDLASFQNDGASTAQRNHNTAVGISLRERLRISFSKDRYHAELSGLKEANADFAQLRTQLKDLLSTQRTDNHASRSPVSSMQSLPTGFSEVKSLARRAYEALQTGWRCSDESHLVHFANVQKVAPSRASFPVAVYSMNLKALRRLPISLVFEDTTSSSSEASKSISSSKCIDCGLSDLMSSGDVSRQTLKRTTAEVHRGHHDGANKRFKSSTNGAQTAAGTLTLTYEQKHSQKDSKSCRGWQSLCLQFSHLSQSVDQLQVAVNTVCQPENVSATTHSGNGCSFANLLGNVEKSQISVPQQLRLAQRLVELILQYFATPWLSQASISERIRIIWNRDTKANGVQVHSDEEVYLMVEFPAKDPSSKPEGTGTPGVTADVADTIRPSDDRSNDATQQTMYQLGVLLMSVGNWAHVEVSEQRHALRTARSHAPLGSRYQRIVVRCLECDFGAGKDLDKADLQETVHREVIGTLEDMMKGLSI